ncbi:BpFREP15.1 [Biomphalaria pfeifferi]|uniref:BpFREP15.1 n=1 Tax=Biomphalaria pfeifferi TaxID=112525 RepID=A0AAD8BVM3_BIOPF|nr:BpFREP15.1 [Biomphalaria pfeifferi]
MVLILFLKIFKPAFLPAQLDLSVELLIDVQPSVISPEITRQLVISCSITNNQVQHIKVIKTLTLSRYNETIREFEDLFVLNTLAMILKQQTNVTVSQISYGNTHITLTLHNPSQFDAKVYRCHVTGDTAERRNISMFAKKAVEYETNLTALIEEIRRYKKNENFQCTLKKYEHSEANQSRLHFYGSSEIITELIEPLTITCLYKTLNQSEKEKSALQTLYILHEANGVIAYINKQQPAITTIQKSNLKNVEGEIFDNESKDSYLQVTWNNLKHSDSGKYFCEAHINRSDGRFDQLNDIVTIIVQSSTLDDLAKVTYTLLRQAEIDKESLRDNEQKLKIIKEDLDINIHNIINVKKDLNDKQENIIRIYENLDTKQQDITCLKEDMNSTKQDIISLKDNMNSTKQDILSLKNNMNCTKQDIVSIKKDLDTTQANIKSINEDFYTNIQNITSIKKDMNTYKENILRIETDLDSNKQNILSIRREADINKQDILRIKEDLDTKQQSMLSIRENVDTNRHNMRIFQENLTTMVANLSTELKEVQDQIHKVNKLLQFLPVPPTPCRNVSSPQTRAIVVLFSGLQVMCDTKTDGGGWIIIQRRVNGKVDFYRGWKEYRDGFGDYNIGEFYLGNENIFTLTSTGQFDLRIDLEYNNKTYFAQYEDFKVLSETEKYKLEIGKHSGNATDSLSYHNNMFFSTFDRNNDKDIRNCAQHYSGAWWYNNCHQSNLNGKWGSTSYGVGLNWASLTGHYKSVSFSEMKIKERD